ncbi:acyltransferase family protein [Gluconacetobacter tumulisoli]|uniref:Acyltransferase n=1 Tax=Gluconacetobacter tumulisoli TaxID=1286189 RepID=A0A7W4PLT6_9PROT|nr:acyltransferase [Gluconacetobacter tumulisoli]MBB2200964.1 acyltransferase [Gluconacetobacter tumulisoli]
MRTPHPAHADRDAPNRRAGNVAPPSPDHLRGRNTIVSIQYLRAMAAIGVVLFHQFQNIFPDVRFFQHGVDLFFVISGFIMIALTDGRDIGPRHFYLDRIARIVPPYWAATALTILLAAGGIFTPSVTDRSPGHLLASLLFIPAWGPGGHIWPTLYLGWTLQYEVFFYLVFGALLMLDGSRRLGVVAVLFGTLVMLGATWPPRTPALTIYTSPLLLEFLAGMVLGRLYGIRLNRMPGRWIAGATAALTIGFLLLIPFHHDLLFGAGAIVIASAALSLERAGYMPRSRILLELGAASYAIYLFQQIAFDMTGKIVGKAASLSGLPVLTTTLLHPANVLAALLLGVMMHRYLEKPLTEQARIFLNLKTRGAAHRMVEGNTAGRL